jgi:uncharacterized protein YecE (DUF72 family)
MVDYYIGTMGFSYQDWSGAFYPKGLTGRDYLSYYSRIFNAVEIDSTFYGTPRRESVIRWKESVPDGFRICVKVPRSITHDAKIIDVHKEMEAFINAVRLLDEKLGVILLQFPPSFSNSKIHQVEDFIKDLPKELNFAVEFRHLSWYIPRTGDMLARDNICWAATEFQGVPKEVDLTSDILFIRFVGQHGRFRHHDREQIEISPQLEWWWAWIQSQTDRVHSIYCYFNDDFSGHAPAAANKLKYIIGLPVVKPNLPKQMKLL